MNQASPAADSEGPAARTHRRKRKERRPLPTIGWREWVALPDLGVTAIKAKIDTGARTSALHAFNVEIVEEDGVEVVRFNIHPLQRTRRREIEASAPLHAHRWVRSSNGQRSLRPTIVTELQWNGLSWPIELTLTNRDEMGFRMLLGRQAVRRRAIIDPGRSYLDREAARSQRERSRKPAERRLREKLAPW